MEQGILMEDVLHMYQGEVPNCLELRTTLVCFDFKN